MTIVEIELHATRVPIALGVFYPLLAGLPWLLALPAWVQSGACAAVVIAALPLLSRFRSGARTGTAICALRIEPHGGLSAVCRDRGGRRRIQAVRDFRVPRLLLGYAELSLEFEDGGTVAVFILPGLCRADAFRRLRKYLLQAKAAPYRAPLSVRLWGRLRTAGGAQKSYYAP